MKLARGCERILLVHNTLLNPPSNIKPRGRYSFYLTFVNRITTFTHYELQCIYMEQTIYYFKTETFISSSLAKQRVSDDLGFEFHVEMRFAETCRMNTFYPQNEWLFGVSQ